MIAHSLDCMFDERPAGMRSRSLLHPLLIKWQALPANVKLGGGGRMRNDQMQRLRQKHRAV
jgi:hypothetical protein